MEWIIAHKIWLLLGVSVVLFSIETKRPFKKWHESRWHHILRNFAFIAVNTFVMGFFYVAMISFSAHMSTTYSIGLLHMISVPLWMELLIAFIVLDVALYFWHFVNHKIPFLWRFHKVHHSDRDLDFTSATRFHVGELVLSAIVKSIAVLFLGIPLLYILVFDVCVTLFALFNHSNISLGRLEKFVRMIIVTPAMHRIHHSMIQKETDTNYTTILSLWDRLFGTYHFFKKQDNLEIGLSAYRKRSSRTLLKMLLMPFLDKTDIINT